MQQIPDEVAVHKLEISFEELVSNVEDYAVFTMSPEGVILDWNRGAEKLKGYSPREIIGRHFSIFYSGEDNKAGLPNRELEIARQCGRFADEGWRFRRDGSRFWASLTITTIRDSQQRVQGFLKITRDLTQRREAEQALRESDERFRLLLEGVQDYAIFILDPEGHVSTWNSGAKKIKLYTESEILGKHFSIFYPQESRAIRLPDELLKKALKDGRAEDEGWRVRKDGSRFWANVVITPLYDHEHQLRGFAKITRDLSEQRDFEQMREAGHRKDAFLATLAHELRNPLAPLLPGLDMLIRNPGDTALVSSIAEMAKRQISQLSHLINDLMDVSRVTAGKIVLKKTVYPLRESMQDAVNSVAPLIEELDHKLEIIVQEELMIEADQNRLTQIISNLLSNAAKYTAPGGRISLEASATHSGGIQISVTDNGMGIPKALHSSIFEIFDQGIHGSAEGLGLGLMLVKTLVELHEGTVEIHSDGEGRGSKFTVTFPAIPVKTVGERSELTISEGQKLRILIADDAKNSADILTIFFQMEGMSALAVYDGEEALKAANEFSPDIVILDIGMPKMDGVEAARRIRQMHPHVFLAALSGWGAPEDRVRTAEAGFNLHLVKPVCPDDLRELLEQVRHEESRKT